MTTQHFLLSNWTWHPLVLTGCVVAALAYFGMLRSAGAEAVRRRAWLFAAALGIVLLALISPLETLAAGYLFSAHMLQHLLLLLVVPPLLLLSLPAPPPTHQPRSVQRLITKPFLAWPAGVGAMWLWHAPALCDAAAADPLIRGFQSVSLLAAGTLFWWPIFSPQQRWRLSPLAGIFYLFTACTACTLLGILITFAPVTVCSIYLHPADPQGLLGLIRGQWGMTPKIDQQVGGLLMWVPACLIYLSAILALLARWYRPEQIQSAPAAPIPSPANLA